MYAIFEAIINDHSLESSFLRSTNQKSVLGKLTFLSIQPDYSFGEFSQTCICGKEYKKILFHLLSIFANVILNDYVKNMNNLILEAKKTDSQTSAANKKKRKLQTFQ